MIKQENRNVVYISDINQAYYAMTNALMIKEQSSKDVKVNLILVDIEQKDKDILNKIIDKFNLDNVNLIYLSKDEMSLGKSKLIHVTNTTNVRLYLASVMSDVDNLLYLDNDTVIQGDINDLFDYVEPNNFYAVQDTKLFFFHPGKLKRRGLMKKENEYVNAGVMYWDLKSIRENDLEKEMIRFLSEEKISFADQDVLNCNVDFEYLPYTWNLGKASFPKIKKDIAQEYNLKIFHYLQWGKQWKRSKVAFTKFSRAKNNAKKIWKENYERIQEVINE